MTHLRYFAWLQYTQVSSSRGKTSSKEAILFRKETYGGNFYCESCIKEWSELEGQIYLSHYVKDWLNKLLTKTCGVPIQHLPTPTP